MRATSSVIVGRDAEIELLGEALESVRRGAGRAVFLVGEAGIGKSRLAGECALRAYDRDMPVLRGRATSTGLVVPFRPLVEALASRFRAAGAPDDPELDPYRPALAGLVPEWRAATAVPGYTISLVELAEALLRLLAVLGRERGCVILLEDLHDSDTETIAVVEYIVDNVADLPVLLVGTLRPDPGPASDLALAAELRNTASVAELGPLDEAAVRNMVDACLDAGPGDVPPAAHRQLARRAGGNPYLVEVLLADLLDMGRLSRADGGWLLVDHGEATVPTGAVRSWARRLGRLDEPVRELLLIAATLGGRFSVGALRAVTGLDDRALFAHLRSASEAGIIAPDGAAHDHYTFRHVLTADALRASLPPAEQAALARRAASAIEESAGDLSGGGLPGELSGEQSQLVATLRLAAGDKVAASRQFAQVGRQMLDAGASGSAAVLLERARGLAADGERDEVTVQLAIAQAESGRVDEASVLLDDLPPVPVGSRAAEERAQAHTQVAWVATMAEQQEEARRRIRAARALLGAEPRPEQEAALVVVEGHLALLPERDGRGGTRGRGATGTGGPGAGEGEGPHGGGRRGEGHASVGRGGRERLKEAERSARSAALTAEQRGRPVVACQAWQLLALLSRERGFDEADACLGRMLEVAEKHRLAVSRAEALVRLGTNAFMRTGEATQLETARAAAHELGSLAVLQTVDGLLAMQSVLGGRWDRAREIVDRSVEASARLQNLSAHRYLLLVDATLAAHQGRARELDRALARFRRAGGEESMLVPLQRGLCQAVGALMAEDRKRATAELDAALAWEREHPSFFYLSGRYGLRPLLRILDGDGDGDGDGEGDGDGDGEGDGDGDGEGDGGAAGGRGGGRAVYQEALASPGGQLAWNRMFLGMADAVLRGRDGDRDGARRAVEEAGRAAVVFPQAWHLALRLVAEAALADSWGEPVAWLRTAEEYFHEAGVQPVAGACRAVLRQAGVSVPQRRGGRERIPAELRTAGVTPREYEVFVLLMERPGNLQIAQRLCISPRTVEKHMASLMTKTGCADRSALCALSAERAEDEGSTGAASRPTSA
ncbi:LuxR family transcriptional regulator [Streptomyces sp. NBC_00572]|uniref:helix-turn-helix transcriptional regulator n=1 Tax=Streptomyces sp. NBC_00572 TaxID=2903664 RepID=UPI002256A008|nr:LuxR family transcriptional regulator [Streptomyces sp. NBC_00572]MCX4986473.1 AAA family ATPase [Streptomyces sp. NBC_00572]